MTISRRARHLPHSKIVTNRLKNHPAHPAVTGLIHQKVSCKNFPRPRDITGRTVHAGHRRQIRDQSKTRAYSALHKSNARFLRRVVNLHPNFDLAHNRRNTIRPAVNSQIHRILMSDRNKTDRCRRIVNFPGPFLSKNHRLRRLLRRAPRQQHSPENNRNTSAANHATLQPKKTESDFPASIHKQR